MVERAAGPVKNPAEGLRSAMTDSPNRMTRKSPRRMRWWHLLLIFFGLVVATFVLWRVVVGRAVKAELQAIRDAGYPATAAELDAWYERVPDEENAALLVREAVRLMREPTDEEAKQHIPYVDPDAEMPDDPASMPAERARAVADYIELNQDALAKLREAVTLERSRYPSDFSQGYDTSLPHLPAVRKAARLLDVEALLHLHHGRTEAAADSARAILQLSETLEDEPLLISQLVRISVRNMGAVAVEKALQQDPLSDRTLINLADCLKDAETPSPMQQGLVGERAAFDDAFDRDPAYYSSSGTPEWWIRVLWELHHLSGLADYDELVGIDLMNEVFDISQLPCHKRMAAVDAWDRKVESLSIFPTPITRVLIPPHSNAFTVELLTLAQLRTSRAAIAVERYRLAHGALPQKLEDVAPDFIDTLPADPFTGDPLRYKTLPEGGFFVYSVGQDKADDGGAKTNAAGVEFEPGSDIPFTVAR